MKNALFSAVLFALLFSSCDKDAVTRLGYITYEGDKYSLHEGYMNYTGTKIFLVSSSVTFSFSDSEHYSGKGNVIDIKGLPDSGTGFPATGIFDLKGLEGGLGINYDFESDTYDYVTDFETIISGTLEIAVDGDECEINLEFRDENETVVRGYFKGPLVKGQ